MRRWLSLCGAIIGLTVVAYLQRVEPLHIRKETVTFLMGMTIGWLLFDPLSGTLKKRLIVCAGLLVLIPCAWWLSGSDPATRARLVGRIRGEKFVKGLPISYWTAKLQDPSEAERFEAILTLAPERAAIPELTGRLRDPKSQLRQLTAIELAKFGPVAESTIPALTEMLQDEDKSCREAAALALEKIKR